MSAAISTYVRRNIDGAFEYGWLKRAKNFRKQNDTYTPVGQSPSCAEAESLRAALISPSAGPSTQLTTGGNS